MPQLPNGQFTPSDYGDMRDFTPVPPGKYISRIIGSLLKDTSKGGQMLVIDFEIAAGPYTGKVFVTRLNLVNANPTAVKIANEELATIARAVKLGPITTSEQLHGLFLVSTLTLVPGDGQYPPKNETSFYATTDGYSRDNIPTNPEPDEATLRIIQGVTTVGTGTAPDPTETKVPDAPAGFGNTAPPPVEDKTPAAPAGFAETPAASTPAVDGKPPW